MKNKIPPPVIALITMGLMFAVHMFVPLLKFNFELRKTFAYIIAFIGVSIALLGIMHFRKHKTTIHPLHPEKASTLVTGGLYQVTRNPMYLGLVFVLIAWGFALANGMTFLLIPGFMWFMTEFQIKPEEAAMHKLFGEDYANYQASVRRWI